MKAALNGGLNLSILDGWWDEMFDGENGWAISLGRARRGPRAPRRGRGRSPVRAARAPGRPAVLRALGGPVPRRWVQQGASTVAGVARPARSRRRAWCATTSSSSTSPPRPGPTRWPPTGWPAPASWRSGRRGCATPGRGARRPGRRRPVRRRPGRRAPGRGGRGAGRAVGRRRRGAAPPRPGGPGRRADVTLHRVHGARRRRRRRPRPLHRLARTEHAGRYGFTVRIVPRHPDLVSPVELGLVAWA